jgi:RNA polymerase subunit RPABC4/transcription elongation factor Spt4
MQKHVGNAETGKYAIQTRKTKKCRNCKSIIYRNQKKCRKTETEKLQNLELQKPENVEKNARTESAEIEKCRN